MRAELSGYLGRTVVEQRYANPFKEVIEAVYVFPLPSMAAVNDFVMEVNGRTIVGIVRPRAEAERIYQEARARGQTASLLTQERPNIFTQSVANIEPGGRVNIKITYFERLTYEHGEYEWVFPMVVGPRYIPGGAKGPALLADDHQATPNPDGGGWSPNTDIVPDASQITPPVLRPGERSGHDIGLTVTLDAGLPITKLQRAGAPCGDHAAGRREAGDPARGRRLDPESRLRAAVERGRCRDGGRRDHAPRVGERPGLRDALAAASRDADRRAGDAARDHVHHGRERQHDGDPDRDVAAAGAPLARPAASGRPIQHRLLRERQRATLGIAAARRRGECRGGEGLPADG